MIYFERKNLLSQQGNFNLQTLQEEEGVSFFQTKTKAVDITIKEIHMDDYLACETLLNVHEAVAITTAYRPGIALTIPLTNQLTYSINGFGQSQHLLNQHFNMIYAPASAGTYHFRKGNYRFFSILFEYSYLKQWKEAHIFLSRFLEDVEARRATAFSNTQLPTTGQMIFFANELFFPGKAFPQMHRQATVIELLRLAIYQCTAQRVVLSKPDLTKEKDELKLAQVKEYITLHLDTPCTTEELAAMVNMNSMKLKKSFKALYGKPIFEYLLKERMARAKQLLQESDLAVREIGQMVGYSRPGNFSSAFNQYFNRSPREFRKNENH